MTALRALTREVPASIARCELTHIERVAIDLVRARRQHEEYEAALARLGCAVERLEEEPDLADSVFVEDTALVLDEVAVMLLPGAMSRRSEIAGVAHALERHRPLLRMEGPGTIDGGDVLRVRRTLYVGLSTRSSHEGIAELRALVGGFGYDVRPVEVTGCLHLKSAATEIGDGTLLVNPAWVEPADFAAGRAIAVDPGEPYAANALRIRNRLIYPTTFPATAKRLTEAGFELEPVDLSELAKAEGAVTCCSLVFET
jgi:dimethylargininase